MMMMLTLMKQQPCDMLMQLAPAQAAASYCELLHASIADWAALRTPSSMPGGRDNKCSTFGRLLGPPTPQPHNQ